MKCFEKFRALCHFNFTYLLATLTSTERLNGFVGLFALNKISINRCSHSKVAGSAKSNSIPIPPASSSGDEKTLNLCLNTEFQIKTAL